jgi:precorrin-2 dehydrogenase/sirohydrochlorin ferrochelatase
LITVSTGGKSPGVAKQIRQVLAEEFDDRWQTYLEIVERWRKAIRDQGTGGEREAFWRDLLTREMVDWVRQGRFREIEERIQDGIGRFRD